MISRAHHPQGKVECFFKKIFFCNCLDSNLKKSYTCLTYRAHFCVHVWSACGPWSLRWGDPTGNQQMRWKQYWKGTNSSDHPYPQTAFSTTTGHQLSSHIHQIILTPSFDSLHISACHAYDFSHSAHPLLSFSTMLLWKSLSYLSILHSLGSPFQAVHTSCIRPRQTQISSLTRIANVAN